MPHYFQKYSHFHTTGGFFIALKTKTCFPIVLLFKKKSGRSAKTDKCLSKTLMEQIESVSVVGLFQRGMFLWCWHSISNAVFLSHFKVAPSYSSLYIYMYMSIDIRVVGYENYITMFSIIHVQHQINKYCGYPGFYI